MKGERTDSRRERLTKNSIKGVDWSERRGWEKYFKEGPSKKKGQPSFDNGVAVTLDDTAVKI